MGRAILRQVMLVDLILQDGDREVAAAQNMRLEKACEQLEGCLSQGIQVVIKKAPDDVSR